MTSKQAPTPTEPVHVGYRADKENWAATRNGRTVSGSVSPKKADAVAAARAFAKKHGAKVVVGTKG